jgi:hypothetical protein
MGGFSSFSYLAFPYHLGQSMNPDLHLTMAGGAAGFCHQLHLLDRCWRKWALVFTGMALLKDKALQAAAGI